jgi:CheY-like chemotaxis protein/HPt (histidine-containing phosphotransfer) domain-containing protein/anti-sigma regulatory factor (Ser/Thr protein kinase)
MMHFLIKNKNVAFDIDMKGDIPRYLYGDNARLRQILLNILSNSAKFTEKGYVRLSVSVSDNDICFTVTDTGMGIKKEDIIDLFDAFKQADTVMNRDYKGTGLGLTITKALVEMMNGKIEVESVLGQGTKVRVKIPKVMGDETQVQRYISTKKLLCSSDTNILAVDDNAINLNVICGLLRQCGATVFAAASGKEAIEMLRMDQYNLIFMDHMMPEMDGIETTKKIREMKVNTPVIALTANAVTSAREMLLASGMDDYLSKPIVKEQLYEVLAKWVPDSKYIDTQIDDTVSQEKRSPEDQGFWDKIGKIDDLSCSIGLERVSGQVEIYKDTLKLFSKETRKYIMVLTELLDANDMHNFTIQAHSIKSSLANVGAMSLSAKAYELESAALRRDIDFCTSHLRSFLVELNDLSVKLTEAFSESTNENALSVISPELKVILTGMKDSLDGKKFIEINDDLKKLEMQILDGSLKDKIEEIMDAVIIMDYENALIEIQKLLSE